MEIPQAVKNILPSETKSTPQPEKKLTGSSLNWSLNRPPLVTPNRYPQEIVQDYLNYEENETWLKLLSTKQKTGSDWSAISQKLPQVFLDKLKKVMRECWENGFCNPRIREGKLVWSQILGEARNRKHSDQCTLCSVAFTSGLCRGKNKTTLNGQRNFVPCWR